MTGILLIGVLACWLWACTAITRALMRRLPSRWRDGIGLLIWLGLLMLPVADEIVGGFQFRALCDKNAVFRIGVANPEGRVTRFSANPPSETVPGTAITIYDTSIEYTDIHSGESVVKFHSYEATGGLFIRMLGISEHNSPITMGSAGCSPEKVRGETVSRTLKFSVVN